MPVSNAPGETYQGAQCRLAYPFQECEKRFTTPNELKTHNRIHSGKKVIFL
jgi:hypothetical protein